MAGNMLNCCSDVGVVVDDEDVGVCLDSAPDPVPELLLPVPPPQELLLKSIFKPFFSRARSDSRRLATQALRGRAAGCGLARFSISAADHPSRGVPRRRAVAADSQVGVANIGRDRDRFG